MILSRRSLLGNKATHCFPPHRRVLPSCTQEATVGILRSLFPPWLPGAFSVMFSRPMPRLSCQV